MEFASADTALPAGRWTDELNFLGWQPSAAPGVRTCRPRPASGLTIQWRELHDPEFLRRRRGRLPGPLADLRLLVLRQRDPKGEKLATDDLDGRCPVRGPGPAAATTRRNVPYEQTVEFTVDTPAGTSCAWKAGSPDQHPAADRADAAGPDRRLGAACPALRQRARPGVRRRGPAGVRRLPRRDAGASACPPTPAGPGRRVGAPEGGRRAFHARGPVAGRGTARSSPTCWPRTACRWPAAAMPLRHRPGRGPRRREDGDRGQRGAMLPATLP